MSVKKSSFLFTFILMSAVLMQNQSFASDIGTEINNSVYNPSYVETSALNNGYTIFDAGKIQQMAYTPSMDINAYTSMPKAKRNALKRANKVAVEDNQLAFEPINANMNDANFWVRPYGSIEDVKTGFGKFDTKTYGLYAGVNSGIKELNNGWDVVYGAYTGYTGAHVKDDWFKEYLNGGTLGVEAMFMKDNFFTGLNASAGGGSGEFRERYYNVGIATSYINSGVTSKTGYNFELANGKFIIQPTLTASYVFAHTFGHTKQYADGEEFSIDNDSMNAVQIEHGYNFIGNLDNGWQPYAGVSIVWNIVHSDHVAPWYAGMPDLASRTFVKYGAGVRKTWNDRYSMNLQTYVRNGGRSGIGFQGGFGVALGK